MGPRQAEVVLTGQSSSSLCCLLLQGRVPVLQHLNVQVLHSLMLDTHIQAITKNASGS